MKAAEVLRVLPHDHWCRANPDGTHADCCGVDDSEMCDCIARESLDALVAAGLIEVTDA